MSTRSTTHFKYADDAKPTAIIYRHSDGYPTGAGKDLLAFIEEVSKLGDTRFDDPAYLAAKYVVYLADMFNFTYKRQSSGEYEYERNESKLDFLSVGVVNADPSDIEYRYVVEAGSTPVVRCFEVTYEHINRRVNEEPILTEINLTKELEKNDVA